MGPLSALARRLRKFAALDGNARNAVLRAHVRSYKHSTLGAIVGRLSFLLNRPGSVFVVSYKPDFHYFFDGIEQFVQLRSAWEHHNRVNNFGDLPRFYALYQNVRQVLEEGVRGDFAEVGVFRGNSAKLLQFFARKWERELFLFDTFAGFDTRDIKGIDAEVAAAGFTAVDFEAVRRFVGAERTHFVRGYFPTSLAQLPDFASRRFAVVHIDCDLFEPITAALEIFYDQLERGGLLILHDYTSGWWRGARQAMDRFLAERPERVVLIPDKSGTAMFRKM